MDLGRLSWRGIIDVEADRVALRDDEGAPHDIRDLFPSPSNRVFFWQAAFKFGRPRIFLADGVFEVRGRVFFFWRPRFFF